LDKPLPEQYIRWANNILHGDFGTSIRTKMPVKDLFGARLPATLKLTGISLLLQLLIALPLGLLAAYKKDGFFDRLIMSISLFFAAIPSFWTAVMLILVFSVTLKMLPISGFEGAQYYILPVASMVLGSIASTIRMTKTEVLDVLREKYVLTAYAKGLTRRTVLIRHVLRNALILVVTLVLMNIPWLISGAVIIENIFVIPGMGALLTNSILNQDFAVVQAIVFLIAILTVICNLLSDIINAILDPRIQASYGGGD
ncbi:MAG: ABC transporter permease, partial [Oscillospiraceae bacterium]|nr:ABC transporter permease [Oscillospiraceae bacterium]